MKRIFYSLFLLSGILIACEGNSGKTEDHEEGHGTAISPGTAIIEGVEALEKASDTTSFVCNCEKKCKDKETCEKECGGKCSDKK